MVYMDDNVKTNSNYRESHLQVGVSGRVKQPFRQEGQKESDKGDSEGEMTD